LLNQALQAEEKLDGAKPAADLLAMEGMEISSCLGALLPL